MASQRTSPCTYSFGGVDPGKARSSRGFSRELQPLAVKQYYGVGRGGSVGRGRGVGVGLGVPVGIGVIVAVAVAVAVAAPDAVSEWLKELK